MADNDKWFLYIAQCRNGMYYVGIAKDVEKRIKEHNSTGRSRYTRYRRPLVLKYYELCGSYSKARRREAEIKKFSRKKKQVLIEK